MNFNVTKFYVEILYGKLSIENTTNLSDFLAKRKKERFLLRIGARREDGSDEFFSPIDSTV